MDRLTKYDALIRRVCKQVAFNTNPRYGFEIVGTEDLVQEVYLKLHEYGTDLDGKDSPEAFIRTTATTTALEMVNDSIRRIKHLGWVGRFSFSLDETDIDSPGGPEPEAEVLHAEMLAELEAIIEEIVSKVKRRDERKAVRSYYLEGAQKVSAAERQRRSRAHKQLDPGEVAALQVWRAWNFPEAKRPRTHGDHPATPLLQALS